MRHQVSLLYLLTMLVTATSGEGRCDCTRKPFTPDPPCYSECISALLFYVGEGDLVEELDIPGDLLERIDQARNRSRTSDEILSFLSDDDFASIKRMIDDASDEDVSMIASRAWEEAMHREGDDIVTWYVDDPEASSPMNGDWDKAMDEAMDAEAADEGGSDDG